jgi:hypothetical protein
MVDGNTQPSGSCFRHEWRYCKDCSLSLYSNKPNKAIEIHTVVFFNAAVSGIHESIEQPTKTVLLISAEQESLNHAVAYQEVL